MLGDGDINDDNHNNNDEQANNSSNNSSSHNENSGILRHPRHQQNNNNHNNEPNAGAAAGVGGADTDAAAAIAAAVVDVDEPDADSDYAAFNSRPVMEKLSIICNNRAYMRVMPFIVLWITAGYMPAVFMPAWGAEQFAGCTNRDQEDADNSPECVLDYTQFNKWSALFGSMSGILAFLFGAVLGRATDSFGRKPFFYMSVVLSGLMFAPLMFWPIIWIKFAFTIPAGLNSSDNSYTPVMVAYMSDVLPRNQRTLGYSIGYAFAAIGLIFGVVIAITVSFLFGDNANFIVITILNVAQLVYIRYFIDESLPAQNRKPFQWRNLNPFAPLINCCCYHPIVLWIAIVTFFISLPETGVLELCLIFVLDQLQIDNENDANVMTSLFLISAAAGMVFGNILILPRLQHSFSNLQILTLGTLIFAGSFVLLSMLAFIKSIVFVVLPAFSISVGFMAFAAANGIVTQHLSKSEQGIGFGVIYAVRSITWAVAPFTFAIMYNKTKRMGFPAAVYLFAAVMVAFAVLLILIPLRRTLNWAEQQRLQNRAFTMNHEVEMSNFVNLQTAASASNVNGNENDDNIVEDRNGNGNDNEDIIEQAMIGSVQNQNGNNINDSNETNSNNMTVEEQMNSVQQFEVIDASELPDEIA